MLLKVKYVVKTKTPYEKASDLPHMLSCGIIVPHLSFMNVEHVTSPLLVLLRRGPKIVVLAQRS